MSAWKWFHELAHPEKCYRVVNFFRPWLLAFGWTTFFVGLLWGLCFAPADYQQGDAFRIIYVHVPAAMISMMSYAILACCGAVILIFQIPLAGLMIPAIAPVGAAFTTIALATGAIWGKPMWGTWWVWDARLTSELILLFLFIGVNALYHLFSDKKQAIKAAGLLAVVGVINLPIIHFSVEWWNTLHQGSTLFRWSGPSIVKEMLWPLLTMLFSFTCLMLGLSFQSFCHLLLEQECHRPWAYKLMTRNGL